MRKDLYIDLYEREESHWWHLSKRKLLFKLLNRYAKKGVCILDVGCGTGKNLEELGNFGKAEGVDNSSEAINFCKKRGLRKVYLVKENKFPFNVNSFDVVTALDVIEHTHDSTILKEIKRVLVPGGKVIATVPAHKIMWTKWDEILHHKKRYSKKELISIFKKQGFKVLFISHVYSFLVIPAILIRKIKSYFRANNYSSDFEITNRLLNKILLFIAEVEQFLVFKFTLPVGTSIVCVVQKSPEDNSVRT